jgi:aerotaxis receptor
MRVSFPVTQKELPFPDGAVLLSRTDEKGVIDYANGAFVRISGFTEEELLGRAHNIVRHPDVPPAVFADMWRTLREGRLWNGIVKNRAKSGDHYWVEANVTPVVQGEAIIGYTSVRTKPARADVEEADALYKRINAGGRLPGPVRRALGSLRARLGLPMAAALVAGLVPALLPLLGVSLPPMVAGAALAVLVLCGVGAGAVVISTLRRIDRITNEMVRIQAEGDLRRRLPRQGTDEVGELVKAFNALMGNFQGVAYDITRSTAQLAGAAGEMSATAQRVLTSCEVQSEAAASTAAAIEQITVSINEVAARTGDTSSISREASGYSSEGQSVVQQASASMNRISQTVRGSAEKIGALGARSRDISQMVHVIREVAEQTNLLALNAAIEAARAGDHGRGFAVVADEVRKLAVRTGDATNEITPLIQAILEEAAAAVQAMQACTGEVEEGVANARKAGDALQKISDGALRAEQKIAEIADASREQGAASHEMAVNVERVAQMAESNSAAVREAAAAAHALAQLAAGLQETAARFRV